MEVRARQDEDPVSFDFIHPDPRFVRYPLNLRCTTGRSVHDDWLVEIRKYAADTSQFSKEHCTMVHFVLKSSEFFFTQSHFRNTQTTTCKWTAQVKPTRKLSQVTIPFQLQFAYSNRKQQQHLLRWQNH